MATAVNMSGQLLMPKATAVWLIENTALTFRQIAEFTALTEIEIEALADGEIGRGLVGRNPMESHELTQEELERCQADPSANLKIAKSSLPPVKTRAKGPRYTPVSKRGDKPDAIAWLGILLIAGAGLYVFVRETVLGRYAKWKRPLPRNR